MTPHEIRRENRRTAYKVFCQLDKEHGCKPGLVEMMRDLVLAYGIEGALRQCDFAKHRIPQEALDLQKLACEYILFEAEEAKR